MSDAATTTYSGRGLQGRIIQSLGQRIVAGELLPGEVIDLDQLASDEGVSRTVVREAVKVMVGKGLLDARPRFGTFVRERAAWNLFDPEVMEWRSAGDPDVELLEELGELRSIVEPMVARLASSRRTPEHLASMRSAFTDLGVSLDDVDAHVEADLRFHRALAAATGNELLEQLAVMLEPVQRSRDALVLEHLEGDLSFLDLHGGVLEAVERGDADAAEASMHALLDAAKCDIDAIIQATTQGQQR